MIKREQIEWRDIWVTGANDVTLPRILLVGDSIARSYFAKVEEELEGAFLCARLATSACVCDPSIEKELSLLFNDYRFAVIHFNNGLHGWDIDEQSYLQGLGRVLDFIVGRSQESRLILATSTPMRQKDDLLAFDPKTDRVVERNKILREMAAHRNLPVNDLFGSVVDRPECFAEDGVHFNPIGQGILGSQVAQTILREIGQIPG